MFISALELFKIGIGPSSSHTMGPMIAARDFIGKVADYLAENGQQDTAIRCTLKGSLAFTGKGHATDRALTLGLHGYTPEGLANEDVESLVGQLWETGSIELNKQSIAFNPESDIIFDMGEALPEHPNGMIFELLDESGETLLEKTYFSIGGGFITTAEEIEQHVAPLNMKPVGTCPYPFDSAAAMLKMSLSKNMTLPYMKRVNEQAYRYEIELDDGLDAIWNAMKTCVERGLEAEGILPGGLNVKRRAKDLHRQLLEKPGEATINDWLCAYAMAVNEENAAGHMVVTAPTNGAAGVIPAVLYYLVKHENISQSDIRDFLLASAAIGGLIKHRSSISGAEVGCQGEVGSASSMAAAGLAAIRGGSTEQVENAAEIALEHHLGMTCDPVNGLVQVPCIERNGFGAIKAFTAASLAIRGSGDHFMPLDNCIAAMNQTGREMSDKFKETSQGGLAVSFIEC